MIPCRCDPDKRLRRLSLDEIQPFQRSLKKMEAAQHVKLARSLQELGFSFPEFVWHHPDGRWLCIDGHQRLIVLAAEGWMVDGGIPVVEIEAVDEQEAAKKLLVASSTYGKVQLQGVYEFSEAHGLVLPEFELLDLPDFDLSTYIDMFYPSDPGMDGYLSSDSDESDGLVSIELRGKPEVFTATTVDELHKFAQRHGLNVISDDSSRPDRRYWGSWKKGDVVKPE